MRSPSVPVTARTPSHLNSNAQPDPAGGSPALASMGRTGTGSAGVMATRSPTGAARAPDRGDGTPVGGSEAVGDRPRDVGHPGLGVGDVVDRGERPAGRGR